MHHPDTPICNAAQFDCQPGNPMVPNGCLVVPLETAQGLERQLIKEQARAIRYLNGLTESERELAQLRKAAAPANAVPDALNTVILRQLLKADDYDSIEAVKAAAQDYLNTLNACPLNFPHQPHDHCDGTPFSSRHPVNPVSQINPVPVTTPEAFQAHGHTWTRHTPGDPCPVPENSLVAVLLRKEVSELPPLDEEINPAWHYVWTYHSKAGFEIIGWRHASPSPSLPLSESPRPATPPATSPAAPRHPPGSADDTPHSSAPESAPPAP